MTNCIQEGTQARLKAERQRLSLFGVQLLERIDHLRWSDISAGSNSASSESKLTREPTMAKLDSLATLLVES